MKHSENGIDADFPLFEGKRLNSIATIEAGGPDEVAVTNAFKTWFFARFDADDEGVPAEDGLHGIVHYLSEPACTEQGCRVNADLGPAPEAAVEDLLFRLVDAGATRITVG